MQMSNDAHARTHAVRGGRFRFSAERRHLMREFAVFWGCTIPARFPFIEKSTRVVFDALGATIHELSGHTCCPEGTLVKANSEDAFYAAAARNLAIIERAGLDVVTPCNGCYSTFKEAQSHLRKDRRHRAAVNGLLETEGLRYQGDLGIMHIAEWLADGVGTGTIGRAVTRPLSGMRIAVHYGCHLLRPQPAVHWDDPLKPTKVEAIISALGATVVDYSTKMMCCGGALDRVGERDSSLAFARQKLTELTGEQVDALVVVCPSCFQQFDLNQAALRRNNEDLNIPVFFLTELMALAMGHDPATLGFDLHRVPVDPFLAAWEQRTADRELLAEVFDLKTLATCDSCRACKDDCPVSRIDPDFQPVEIIADLLAGKLDDVVAGEQIWKCVECFTCQERCHSRIGWAGLFRTLKERAIAAGNRPDSVVSAYEEILSAGTLGRPRESMRKKLGLRPLPPTGGDALARLLADTKE